MSLPENNFNSLLEEAKALGSGESVEEAPYIEVSTPPEMYVFEEEEVDPINVVPTPTEAPITGAPTPVETPESNIDSLLREAAALGSGEPVPPPSKEDIISAGMDAFVTESPASAPAQPQVDNLLEQARALGQGVGLPGFAESALFPEPEDYDKIEQFNPNPRINVLVAGAKKLRSSGKKLDANDQLQEDAIYELLNFYLIQESKQPTRPLDQEILKRRKESDVGFTEAVRQKRGGLGEKSGDERAEEFVEEFGLDLREDIGFSNKEYQQYALQDLAMKAGLDFNKLNESYMRMSARSDEEELADITIDTRWADNQFREVSADLLNIPLGLAVLGYGLGHSAITEDQETGPPGELFDVHSKAFNNIVSIKSIEQFKEKETDVFGIEETAKRLTSGIPVVTHLDNLNKISHRSGKVIYGEDNRYVPLMLPSDVSEWMSTRDEWRETALGIIETNVRNNPLIEVPFDSTTAYFGQTAHDPQSAAVSVVNLLEGAMFTGDVKEALGDLAPLVEGVPLPTEGDTLGKKLGRVINDALYHIDSSSPGPVQLEETYRLKAFYGDSPRPRTEIELEKSERGQVAKESYDLIFVNSKGVPIPVEQVQKFSDELKDDYISEYIQSQIIGGVRERVRKGDLGKAYYNEQDSPDYKELKEQMAGAVVLSNYMQMDPKFATTSDVYMNNLAEGFSGIPEDILLSFIAADIALSHQGLDFTGKKGEALKEKLLQENVYSAAEIEGAFQKLKKDAAYVALDIAMLVSILGMGLKGAIIGGRATSKTIKDVSTMPRTAPTSSQLRQVIDTLRLASDRMKVNLAAEKMKVVNAGKRQVNREDVDSLASAGGQQGTITAVFTGEKGLVTLEKEVRAAAKKLDEAKNNSASANPAEVRVLEKDLKVKTHELEVRKAYKNDEFDSLSNRPKKQEPGPETHTFRESVETYEQFKTAQKAELDNLKTYDDLLDNASAADKSAAQARSKNVFEYIFRNSTYNALDPFAPANAKKVLNLLQSSGITDPGVYRYFLNNTRGNLYKATNNTVANLIAGTKVSLAKKSKAAVRELVETTGSKQTVAKLQNSTLREALTREEALSIADEMSTMGITNEFAYARLPFLSDEAVRYFVNQARNRILDPKNRKAIIARNPQNGMVYYQKGGSVKSAPPPPGLRMSEFRSLWGVSADKTRRLFFGDKAVNLARNKDYTYALAQYMSEPLAFVSVPRSIQNWVSDTVMHLDTVGKSDTFLYSFLDSAITPENRVGGAQYSKLLAASADRSVDLTELAYLLDKIPQAKDLIITSKQAKQAFDLGDGVAPDFAKINNVDLDYLIQGLLTKDDLRVMVNDESIFINDLLELRVDQTQKLRQDIAKINKRLKNLKEDSPLYRELTLRKNKAQQKIDSGDVIVSIDELYESLPKKRAELKELLENPNINPRTKQIQAQVLEGEIRQLASVSQKEAIKGVKNLKWYPKKEFAAMSPTEKSVYYVAQEIVTPIQEKIYKTMSQILIADDAVILSQKNSRAPKNFVVRITDEGYEVVKSFDNSVKGAAEAYEFSRELNKRTRNVDNIQKTVLVRKKHVEDVPGAEKATRIVEERPSGMYRTMSADELAATEKTLVKNRRSIPVVKRAMDTPGTDIVPMMARYLSVYVDGSSLAVAARELLEVSSRKSPATMQRLVNEKARQLLYGIDEAKKFMDEVHHGNAESALAALLDMNEFDLIETIGQSFTAQERFYAKQAFGNVMTPAELLSITANARFRVYNTYKGLVTNLEQYRILNAIRAEGGLLTPSEYALLNKRQQSRYVHLSSVYSRTPGAGGLESIGKSALDTFKKIKGKTDDPETPFVGDKSGGKTSLFGGKDNLYISRESATYLSDFAGLVELTTRLDAKFISMFKQSKILSFTSGIMPIQLLSSLFMHGFLLSRTPGALMNKWVFSNAHNVLADVIRIKMGRKAKNPKVEEAARNGSMSTGRDIEFYADPNEMAEVIFLSQALEAGEAFAKNPSSRNGLDKFVRKIVEIYENSPGATRGFMEKLKVSTSPSAAKPRPPVTPKTVGEATKKAAIEGTRLAGDVIGKTTKTLQTVYSLPEDFLKTLYAVSANKTKNMPMKVAVAEGVKTWFNYGNLSRNANAMRYGVLSPFTSLFIGYLGNAWYAFPEIFAKAPIRAAIAGHALNVHNQSAIEAIRMYEDISQMRLMNGDAFAFALPKTFVERGKLSQVYGTETQSSDIVDFGQLSGTMRRADPSVFGRGVSFLGFVAPDHPDPLGMASSGVIQSAALKLGGDAYDMMRGFFGNKNRTLAEKTFDAMEKEGESTIDTLENLGRELTEGERQVIADLEIFLDDIARNDFHPNSYKTMATIIPTQITDILKMAPTGVGIFPDRDPAKFSDYAGVALQAADITKVKSFNLLSATKLENLKREYEQQQIRMSDPRLSEDAMAALQPKLDDIIEEIEKAEINEKKMAKLNEMQAKHMDQFKAAIFSLRMTTDALIFLQEMERQKRY